MTVTFLSTLFRRSHQDFQRSEDFISWLLASSRESKTKTSSGSCSPPLSSPLPLPLPPSSYASLPSGIRKGCRNPHPIPTHPITSHSPVRPLYLLVDRLIDHSPQHFPVNDTHNTASLSLPLPLYRSLESSRNLVAQIVPHTQTLIARNAQA